MQLSHNQKSHKNVNVAEYPLHATVGSVKIFARFFVFIHFDQFVQVIVWFRVQFGKQHARVSFSKTIEVAQVRRTSAI